MEEKFIVSPAPHIYSQDSTKSIMRDVLISLLPAIIAAVYFFRGPAIMTIAVSVLSAVVAEIVSRKIMNRDNAISDMSAILTGLLFAFVLPPSLPLWITAIGSAVSIVLGKQIFGGLGQNPFNPALVGRAVLLAAWPVEMTTWTRPFPFDTVTCATPLAIQKEGLLEAVPDTLQMFLGNRAGSLGETCILALLIGAAYLLAKKRISFHIPFFFIGVTALISFVLKRDILFDLFAGGLILGAFFMATDYVTSPITKKGKIIFGIGCGMMTMLIRLKGGFPEGVCYAILIMNMFTPAIDRLVRPKKFGFLKKRPAAG